MCRLSNFRSLKTHPWYGRLYKKLTSTEIGHIAHHLSKTNLWSNDDYCKNVLRMEYSEDLKQTKNKLFINELLLVAGTMEFQPKQKGAR